MTVKLLITVSFNSILKHFLGKTLEVPDSLAREMYIKNGQCRVIFENEEKIKITYRGSVLFLPKNEIKILTVEKKGILDFGGKED